MLPMYDDVSLVNEMSEVEVSSGRRPATTDSERFVTDTSSPSPDGAAINHIITPSLTSTQQQTAISEHK